MTWYHASPTRYKPGDIIVGKSCGWSFGYPVVFMTTSPIPHYTILEKAIKQDWSVYEVKPDKVKIGRCWDEGGSRTVEVVRRVGSARGLAKDKGSQVFWKGRKM